MQSTSLQLFRIRSLYKHANHVSAALMWWKDTICMGLTRSKFSFSNKSDRAFFKSSSHNTISFNKSDRFTDIRADGVGSRHTYQHNCQKLTYKQSSASIKPQLQQFSLKPNKALHLAIQKDKFLQKVMQIAARRQ